MSTRSIRTSIAQAACDVCGRTLLRGERAEIYLSGSTRRSVCELCASRAVAGGWVREGQVPSFGESSSRVDRRRSLLGRLRSRRDDPAPAPGSDVPDGRRQRTEPPELDFDDRADGELAPPPWERERGPERERGRRARPTSPSWPAPVSRAAARLSSARGAQPPREPRHVRAVPTAVEHRIASAVSLFNDSEHPRTVAGVARSLGLPDVSVHPSEANGSVVTLVVSWELCWYRYEADLSDEVLGVRVAGQGYELSELSELELVANAGADERGRLHLNG